jgi:ATP-dependent DNA helicase RecG
MKKWMQEAGLTTPPIIESDRDRNEFDLILLPHHLLDHQTLEWLAQFREIEMSDAQRRTLAFVREIGAITNQDYRQLNGTDTLVASASLRSLRDAGLLEQKGKGNGTYYVLGLKATTLSGGVTPYTTPLYEGLTPHTNSLCEGLTPHINPLHKGLTPYINPLHKGLDAIPKEFPPISQKLKDKILTLPRRSSQSKLKEIIKDLCAIGSLQPSQLGQILNRDPQYLRIHFLSKMQKDGDLKYLYPEQPAHPLQAYLTILNRKKEE